METSAPPMLNTLSIENAQNRIAEFQEKILNSPLWPDDVSKTKACHVSYIDLNNLAQMDITGVRCYLSLDYNESLGKKAISLIIVGTRLLENGIEEDILLNKDGELAIFDFTTPCPDTCDRNSALFNAF